MCLCVSVSVCVCVCVCACVFVCFLCVTVLFPFFCELLSVCCWFFARLRPTWRRESVFRRQALGAILQVDEMIFAALMPKKLQLEIQDLEAIKVHYSRRRSQAESLLTLLLMAALLCWPWFSLLEPLGRTMEKVKKAYCAGNQGLRGRTQRSSWVSTSSGPLLGVAVFTRSSRSRPRVIGGGGGIRGRGVCTLRPT